MTSFDDLVLLRSFVSIVENGGLSAAARALRLSQPTVSRRLRSLEERCGAALVRRDTHRMSLTDAGRAVLADARALLSLAQESQQRLRNEQTALQGHMRIFATIDFGQSAVSRLIADFLRDHPGVTIELAYSNRPMHMIAEGCDAGIIAGDLTDVSVVARSFGPIRRYLVASPGFLAARETAAHPADLADWPWMSLASSQFGGSRTVTLVGPLKAAENLSIAPVFTSEGVTSLREAALLGLGVVVLPEWLVEGDVVSGRLVRVLPEWRAEGLPAHVVYPAERSLPLRVRTFIDFAAAAMAALLRTR